MGNIEDMLESGRAPGLIVRGAWAQKPMVAINPSPEKVSAETRATHDARNFAEAAKLAAEVNGNRRMGRRRDGEVRHIGQSPLAEVCERFKAGQDDVHTDRKKFLKDTGALFPHEK